jgi:hypothetical protein
MNNAWIDLDPKKDPHSSDLSTYLQSVAEYLLYNQSSQGDIAKKLSLGLAKTHRRQCLDSPILKFYWE